MDQQLAFILNCGSSSVKFRVIDLTQEETLLKGLAQKEGEKGHLSWEKEGKLFERSFPSFDYPSAICQITDLVQRDSDLFSNIIGVGHRVVHGGEAFQSAAFINEDALKKIEECIPLAPLHNPINLLGIRAAQKGFPSIPHIAVFDTAFHQTMPDYTYLYPLPYRFYRDYHIRRYGFHGMSHAFVVSEAARCLGKELDKTAFISAHLGAGCSLAAVLGGKSIDTSMGLTPLEGLMMGKRSGDIDPSILPFLQEKLRCEMGDILEILNKKSGLFGISKISDDMRLIEKKGRLGDRQALLAIDMFCYRLAKYIASYQVPLGHVDALIFTGGIGENSTLIREKTVKWLNPLGLVLDKKANSEHGKNAKGVISTKNSSFAVMTVQTDEERLIAREVRNLIL